MSDKDAAIAVTRFGLGARPGEIAGAKTDPRGYLLAQVTQPAGVFSDTLLSSVEAAAELRAYRQARQARREAQTDGPGMMSGETMGNAPGEMMLPDGGGQSPDMQQRPRQPAEGSRPALYRKTVFAEIASRTRHAATTPHSFQERLVRFWSNHFTVSSRRPAEAVLVGAYEREAIRAHMGGTFADLALAAWSHPAMLTYLDQVNSMGPNSTAGQRRDRGMNENLAREAMELHTLGVDGGYTQTDVEELAKALTGWTLSRGRGRGAMSLSPAGQFVFADALHEPGARRVLGKRYREDGLAQGRRILADLARAPATARHIATKLAVHFVQDTPPEAAIAALERVFLDTDGDLPSLHAALVGLDAAWDNPGAKFKTPEEFLISSLRAVDLPTTVYRPNALRRAFLALGQVPFSAPGPDGWPDTTPAWAGPDAMLKRLEWANAVAQQSRSSAPMQVADACLGALVSGHTRQTISRAGSPAQGLTLALMSPEFQRR